MWNHTIYDFYNIFHFAAYDNLFLIIKLILCVRKLVKIKITSNHIAQRQPLLILWFIKNSVVFTCHIVNVNFTKPILIENLGFLVFTIVDR